ncbi:MAG: ROK family protein [Verrucomicrobia bacterium]|nr:ROK family protein [Verrucomicrobiota bacterium]MBU1735750.1 ROK family protein [Verrucomicrobiota bacterium]MBU1855803.1 ROK family protein [Verrucomicrobiota bacterium]
MKPHHQRVAIGIDFGGTAVKAGLVDETGVVLDRVQAATADICARSAWLDFVGQCLRRFGAGRRRRPAGIGVGVPGFVDFKRGYIYNLTNVPGWTRVPLAGMIRKRFGLSAFVDNDVNAMALGECAYGAGRRFSQAVFATLGTGVGGAVVIDGHLYRGAYSMAGEIGHISINQHGRRTPEGRGGLETYVGNMRFVAVATRALRAGRRSVLRGLVKNDLKRLTPKTIALAAQRGDPLARKIFDTMADCLATAFASVTYLIQPEVIIVGGGVAQSGRVLFDPLRRHLRERLHPFFAERIRVIPAVLGEDAGLIGCAALAFAAPAGTRGGR